MSLFTKFLNLFKYDPVNDKVKTFNITKALNENWDKIDTKVEEISNNKVDKVEGKGLSTSDYTLEEKIKLGGISKQATKVETSVINGSIKIDGVNAKVYDDSEISNRVGPLANLLTTIKTSIVNAINSLKTEVDEHKAENASQLNRVSFNFTPRPGYKIIESNCYVINKIAYVNLSIKKTDDSVFSTGHVILATTPHAFLSSICPLNGSALDANGNTTDVKNALLALWNKGLSVQVVSANSTTVNIAGSYLIIA